MNLNTHPKFEAALGQLPLVAILRGLPAHEALAMGEALGSTAWSLVEVPLNSPDPLASIATLAECLPQALVGAGTVLTPADVRNVHAAGGQMVVSPNFNPAVVREAVRLGLVCLPGIMTPTEAFAALEAGATGLKLFPSEMISPAVVRALRAVLPAATRLFAVGGITPENMHNYLAAGVAGFGIGSALYKPGMTPEQVQNHALRFIAAYRAASLSH